MRQLQALDSPAALRNVAGAVELAHHPGDNGVRPGMAGRSRGAVLRFLHELARRNLVHAGGAIGTLLALLVERRLVGGDRLGVFRVKRFGIGVLVFRVEHRRLLGV